jgi:hypothetical protein
MDIMDDQVDGYLHCTVSVIEWRRHDITTTKE